MIDSQLQRGGTSDYLNSSLSPLWYYIGVKTGGFYLKYTKFKTPTAQITRKYCT